MHDVEKELNPIAESGENTRPLQSVRPSLQPHHGLMYAYIIVLVAVCLLSHR